MEKFSREGVNMSAKEMFEKLGFELKKDTKRKIVYKNKGYKTIIIKKKKRKMIIKSNTIIIGQQYNLTMQEQLAVYQLGKELGF